MPSRCATSFRPTRRCPARPRAPEPPYTPPSTLTTRQGSMPRGVAPVTPPPPPTRRWSCVISLTRSGRRASPRTPTSPTACSSWTRRNPGDGYGQGQGPHDPVRCRGAASATDARAPGGAPRRETTRQSTPSRNLRRGNQFMDNRVSPRAGNPDVRGHEDPAGPDDFADHPPVADCRDCGGTGRYVQQWATITWDHEQRGGEYPLVL